MNPIAIVTRWRAVTPLAAIKCGSADAARLVDQLGGHVQQSAVTVYDDGSELLGPWVNAEPPDVAAAIGEAWAKGLAQGRESAARDIERFERCRPGSPATRGALLEAVRIAREGPADGEADDLDALRRRVDELRGRDAG